MAAIGNVRIVVCLLLDICNCSATTELLETVTHLLTGCLRFYPYANRNTTENLIVRFEVALDSTSFPGSLSPRPPEREKRDPGWVWSRASWTN